MARFRESHNFNELQNQTASVAFSFLNS